MRAAASDIVHSTSESPARVRRSRAYRHPGRIWFASLLLVLSFVFMAAFIGLAVALPITHSRTIGIASLAVLAACIAARLWAFFLTRRVQCGLCHGSVLIDNGCRKHAHAARIPPLSWRATTVLSILFTLSFRCMYCGTRFRLWK